MVCKRVSERERDWCVKEREKESGVCVCKRECAFVCECVTIINREKEMGGNMN